MPFDKSRTPLVKKPPSPQDFSFADKLSRSIPKRGKWSRKKWANEFRILQSQLPSGSATTRIEKVLVWYSKHIGEEYVPVVYSAKSFRLKFDNLEAAAKRQDRDNPDITITKESDDLARRLSQLNSWSRSCKDELPLVVQVSWNNSVAFLEKFHKVRMRLQKQSYSKRIVMDGFLDKIYANSFIGGIDSFVQHWMERANDRILNWEGWSGKLMSWAFKEDCKTFESLGMQWAIEYSGTSSIWFKFKELMK